MGLKRLAALGAAVHEPWTETQVLWDPEELGSRLEAEDFDALVVEADFVFEEVFSTAPRLRIVGVCRGALNQVDLLPATEKGVVVVHAPGRNARAVAELVIGQILGLARRIPMAERYLREGRWIEPTGPYIEFQGRELSGATLGIIGLGAIGTAVAKLASAIGMKIVAYDPFAKAVTKVARVELDQLLEIADFVSIHVPDTEETAGLLGAREFQKMKPTACLINVTANAVIDQKALVSALTERRLAGAALDVHEAHPIPPHSLYLDLPNVILTPHIGGATRETIERHSSMIAEDMERYVAGKKPRYLANELVWNRRRL